MAARLRDEMRLRGMEGLAVLAGRPASEEFSHLSNHDLRNTLVVAIAAAANEPVERLQALTFGGLVRRAEEIAGRNAQPVEARNSACVGQGAPDPGLLAALREMTEEVGTEVDHGMQCADDIRNSVIIEIHSRSSLGVAGLQSLTDAALAARANELLRQGALPQGE